MRRKARQIRDEVMARAGETFLAAVRAAMNPEKAAADAEHVRREYPGLPHDALADILVKRAARRTKWEGAANGLGVTACEVVLVAPAPEPSHKLAAGTGVAALLLADIAYTTRIQMQLLFAVAALYGCPFDRDDEDDVYLVFKAALGLKGTERVGTYGRFIFTETARKQFRKLLRTGIRRAIQHRVIKVAGPRIGRYLGEKQLMRLVPVANAGIGYAFNNRVTKSVGHWAKVKSKIRSSAFKQIAHIEKEEPDAVIWVLPVVFYVGTADNALTDNVLTLYSQAGKRIGLSGDQTRRVEELIDLEELPRIFADALPLIASEKARTALYDIAVTAAAINLGPSAEHEACVAYLGGCLKVQHDRAHLREKVRWLGR